MIINSTCFLLGKLSGFNPFLSLCFYSKRPISDNCSMYKTSDQRAIKMCGWGWSEGGSVWIGRNDNQSTLSLQ